MAPPCYFIDPHFLDSISGNIPTEGDYEKFQKRDLSSKQEQELHRELYAVVQSVLNVAGCDVLRFWGAMNPKSCGGKARPGKKEIFTDGGIYSDYSLNIDKNDQTTPEELESRLRHWIDVPFWVRMSERHAGKIYFDKSHGRSRSDTHPSLRCVDSTSPTDIFGGFVDPLFEAQRPSGGGKMARDRSEGVQDSLSDESTGNHFPTDAFTAQPGIMAPQRPPLIKSSARSEVDLSKFVDYMHSLFECQYRTFSYAVHVSYDMARLFYFDRSGILVTEPFRWDEADSPLHLFIWKVAKLASAGRYEGLGLDATATLAYGEAKGAFVGLKDDTSLPQHVREGFKKATTDDYPVYKLEVVSSKPSEDEWFDDIPFPPPDEFSHSPTYQPKQPGLPQSTSFSNPSSPTQPGVRHFLVGRPHFASDKLVGRCTRGYFAYDVTDADKRNWRVCFLKDSWRPVVSGRTRPEHLVYQRLRFFGVNRGIGTLICGGDVGGHWAQRTRVQDYVLADENDSEPVVRVHYRLVLEEIGEPLKEFDSFPELSAIFVDVVRAHYRAWSLARVLHADISVGNIVIVPPTRESSRRRGILIDWDLSRLECELVTGRTPMPNNLGTWQFRSALSLRYPWKPHRRSDDIESFIHVYLYLVLRFHPVDNRSLTELAATLFDGASLVHGIQTGGDRKLTLFRTGAHGAPQIELSSNPSLQRLVQDMIAGCSRSYRKVDHDEMERRYGFAPFSVWEEPETPPVVALLHPTSSGIVDFESDDHIPRFDEETRLEPTSPAIETAVTAPGDDEDPCVVKGFLSEPGNLLDLFKRHAATQLPRSDKACDQFLARRHEDVLTRRCLNTPSIESTSSSEGTAGSLCSHTSSD